LEHSKYGGIIPEIASRAHLEMLLPTLNKVFLESHLELKDVDIVAATTHPGLVGSLSVGCAAAKALAFALNKPFYAVDHMNAHILAYLINSTKIDRFNKFIGLAVSGGHTTLLKFDNGCVEEIGFTLDDAAGETVDKIGRILGLEYPSGPIIDKISKGVVPKINFPLGLTKGESAKKNPYNFSFSGLKTAASREIEKIKYLHSGYSSVTSNSSKHLSKSDIEQISASLQFAINKVLVQKTIKASRDCNIKNVVIGGGYSANSALRDMFTKVQNKNNLHIKLVPLKFCGDNAAMICSATNYSVKNNVPPSKLDVCVSSL
jgi:N6-L-threonylcarbamoyladenine synthase